MLILKAAHLVDTIIILGKVFYHSFNLFNLILQVVSNRGIGVDAAVVALEMANVATNVVIQLSTSQKHSLTDLNVVAIHVSKKLHQNIQKSLVIFRPLHRMIYFPLAQCSACHLRAHRSAVMIGIASLLLKSQS